MEQQVDIVTVNKHEIVITSVCYPYKQTVRTDRLCLCLSGGTAHCDFTYTLCGCLSMNQGLTYIALKWCKRMAPCLVLYQLVLYIAAFLKGNVAKYFVTNTRIEDDKTQLFLVTFLNLFVTVTLSI